MMGLYAEDAEDEDCALCTVSAYPPQYMNPQVTSIKKVIITVVPSSSSSSSQNIDADADTNKPKNKTLTLTGQ